MSRRLTLLLPALAFVATVVLPAPGELSPSAWRVAGVAAWMAAWWLTGVVPLEATALLPLVLLPLAGVANVAAVSGRYADPVIFLFLGGFLIAATLERWGLHRRFATATVRLVGTGPRRLVLGFLLVSALASMWISNTATAVMMLPVATAVVGPHRGDGGPRGLPAALLLAVAYGASIGGVTTLIGTPPNAIFAGTARELLGVDVTFSSWLPFGLSVSIPMLAGCWVVLVWLFRIPSGGVGAAVPGGLEIRRPLDRGDRFVLFVFGATALAWVLRTPKALGAFEIPGLVDLLPGLTDAGVAIAAAVALLVVPLPRSGSRYPVALDWETARRIPWGVLLLFGGGLALASAFEMSGLSAWIGGRLEALRGVPPVLLFAVTAAVFVALTELTSNTATAAIGMPLIVGVAAGLGVPGLPMMVIVALSASMAFMLPVATPPNAIVFGSGLVRTRDMARAGLVLNVMAVGVITLVGWVWYG